MSESVKGKLCKVLTDDADKQVKCKEAIDEFSDGDRDKVAFEKALTKLSEITGLSKPELVKRINEADVPEPPAGEGRVLKEEESREES